MSYYYKYYEKVDEKGLFKLKNCYWYIYGALLQQGGIHLPEAISGRLLIGFWWLFVIVSVTTYSGNLVAFLTFPKIENPVNSIDDVVKHRGVASWGFMSGSVIEDHLKVSEKAHKMNHMHLHKTDVFYRGRLTQKCASCMKRPISTRPLMNLCWNKLSYLIMRILIGKSLL